MDSHDSSTDLGSLVAGLPVAVYRTSPDGRILAGNGALADLLGAATVEELTDVDVRDLYVDPGTRASMEERVAARTRVPTEEIRLRRLDGRIIWARVSSRGVYDPSGEVVWYEGVLEDVTEAHETASALVESNEMLDALTRIQNRFITGGEAGMLFDQLLADLLDISGSEYGFIAGVRHDRTGSPYLRSFAMTNIAWNEETRQMFAEHGPRGMEFHNLDTLFGRPVVERTAIVSNDPSRDPRRAGRPEGHPPLDSFLGLPVLRGRAVLGVIALANRPGGYDDALVERLQPLVATVGSMIESIRADEARRTAEARERSREELFRAVVERAAEAVIAFGDDGVTLAFNPAAEAMTGHREADVLGTPVSAVLGDDLIGRGLRDLRTLAEGVLTHRNGSAVPVEMSVVETDTEERTIYTAILRDVGDRKEAEAALERAKDAAERMSRAKDEFLAGMSHELRTPLNAVIGLSSLLSRQVHGNVNDKQKEYLDQIEESGRHLLELINDVLDLAKIEADKLEARTEPVDVRALVEAAVSYVREAATASGIRLDIDIAPNLPSALADPRRTKQILLNLLSNAVKFTPGGGTVGVEVVPSGDMIAVTVWDTGVGIPPDRLEAVFAPFEQVDHSLARTHEGTGLGLTLSREFAELQGGTLVAESVVDEGSRFTFTVPAMSKDVADTDLTASAPAEEQGRSESKARVLVVEDNEVNRLLVTDYLAASGYAVDVAVDGDEAVEKAQETLPDAILMDVQLPRRDGLSATREIKANPATAGIPVIALTALAMRGDAERCYDAGCDGYLSKPCDPADIVAALEGFLAG